MTFLILNAPCLVLLVDFLAIISFLKIRFQPRAQVNDLAGLILLHATPLACFLTRERRQS